MSLEKVRKRLFERFDSAGGIHFVAILLDLPSRWTLADDIDSHGRSILLIGQSFVGDGAEAHVVIQFILQQLRNGQCPDMVTVIALAPKASDAFVQIVEAGPVDDFLLHGPRWSGKSIVAFAALLALAEWHSRAHFTDLFKAMLLHDSLKSADAKSAQTLELPLWGGLWTIESDRTRAMCRLGGRDFIKMDFIGCLDAVSSERLRQSTHCVMAEELIGSLADGTGITEDQYTLARSSMLRLDTRRRVSVALTNPGAPSLWPYRYWGLGGQPLSTRRAIQIPREDRLSPAQQAQLEASFATNPILQKRLSRGEWVGVVHGAAVAEGFDPAVHLAPFALHPSPSLLLAIGFDGGHSPSAVVGQIQQGQIQIFAAFNLLHAGMLELLEQQVLPWLQSVAPWALDHAGAQLVEIIDPNLGTATQISIMESAEKMIQEKLGGRMIRGAVRWPPRREAVLKALAPRHVGGRTPLHISPGPDTDLLIDALSGAWYYPVGSDGQVDRTGPKKPNSPAADLGDAMAYLCGWLLGGEPMEISYEPIKVEMDFSLDAHLSGDASAY